jgi:O-antigen/teichoic acid export membrane protein
VVLAGSEEPLAEDPRLGRKIAKGAIWMVLFKLTERGLGLVSTMILARLLAPADFGLVAMAMAFIGAIELFTAFSFDTALIQNPQASREHYDTAWTFNVLFGASAALVLVLLAPLSAGYYREPRVPPVLYCLALGLLVQGFENIGVVAFRRELEFRREFQYRVLRKLSGFIVVVPAAFLLRNHWALVAGQLATSLGSVALSYVVQAYRPRFSWATAGQLFRFSRWLLANNLLVFLRDRGPDLVIGRIVGKVPLGSFVVARDISNMPTSELIAPINRAIFPGFARQAAQLERLRRTFLDSLSIIWMIGLPVAIGLAVTADLIVRVVLGPQWFAAIPPMRILAIYGALMILHGNGGYVYIALGRPRVLTATSGIFVCNLSLLLLLLVPRAGVQGAALAFLGASLLQFPVTYVTLVRVLGLRLGQLVAAVWRPVAATVTMGATVGLASAALDVPARQGPEILALATLASAGCAIYFGTLYGLWALAGRPPGAERVCLDRARDQWHELRRGGAV